MSILRKRSIKVVSWILFVVFSAVAVFCANQLVWTYRYDSSGDAAQALMTEAADEAWSDFYYTCDETTPIGQGTDEIMNDSWKQELRSDESYLSGLVNFYYEIQTADGSETLQSNLPEGKELSELTEQVYYSIFHYETNGDPTESTYYTEMIFEPGSEEMASAEGEVVYLMKFGIVPMNQMKSGDSFYLLVGEAENEFSSQSFLICQTALGISALLMVLLGTLLLIGSGWVQEESVPVCRRIHRINFEICLILWTLPITLFVLTEEWTVNAEFHWYQLALAVCCGTFLCVYGLFLIETLAVRLKSHQMGSTSLIGKICQQMSRFCRWLWNRLKQLAGIPQMMLFLAVTFLLQVLFAGAMVKADEPVVRFLIALIWLALVSLAFLILICFLTDLHKIRQVVLRMSCGELEAELPQKSRIRYLKEFGEEIGRVSQSMQHAVEERSKSNRFRADLITNVSHDLKTPLTSIINYVDLLKTRPIEDPDALEYIDILDRKSQRLKKLTEDLIEASKASSGSLPVHKTSLDLTELSQQALGEYEERFEAQNLVLKARLLGVPLVVEADGSHVWRVLDNLLNNCRKYAMPGTRIYYDLVNYPDRIEIWVRNISKEPLTLSEEELQERFTRGDSARNGEGSGLGLSIARSLTELQKGTFKLSVDGDLFKVQVGLPKPGMSLQPKS